MLIFKYKKKEKDLNSVFYKVFKKIKIYKRIIGKNFYQYKGEKDLQFILFEIRCF